MAGALGDGEQGASAASAGHSCRVWTLDHAGESGATTLFVGCELWLFWFPWIVVLVYITCPLLVFVVIPAAIDFYWLRIGPKVPLSLLIDSQEEDAQKKSFLQLFLFLKSPDYLDKAD